VKPRSVRVRAPAKVNLSLAVLGRRADGFHELDTVLMALELGDVLEARARDDEHLELSVSGPAAAGVPSDGTNLALRAAHAVQELARMRGLAPSGAALALEKHVPAAAGLGGGSSDAAAAAFACAELWGLPPDDPALLERLAELGSDCPFFLAARATGLARCTGRGERVEALSALELPWQLVVVTPDVACSTAAVYAALERREGGERRRFDPRALAGLPLASARARLENDLEEAAGRVQPALFEFRARLDELAPGAFRLAGSGSSCFGFFEDARAADDFLARLDAANRGRRYALRARWTGPARSQGLRRLDSKTP
jgi:4-diphosphocytidyl-2-C-methyl-D-erythritol kinase